MKWNLEEALQYYKKQGAPRDQTACVNLLKEIQQEQGGIPNWMLRRAAEEWDTKEGLLLALVRRIPSLHLLDSHTLEVCSGPNCGKRTEIAEFVEKTYGRNPKDFTFRFCGCMRQCAKGPNIRWDGKVYNAATPELVKKLIEDK
jgi:NADH:ubiquinone oxidoreductase subunit E